MAKPSSWKSSTTMRNLLARQDGAGAVLSDVTDTVLWVNLDEKKYNIITSIPIKQKGIGFLARHSALFKKKKFKWSYQSKANFQSQILQNQIMYVPILT